MVALLLACTSDHGGGDSALWSDDGQDSAEGDTAAGSGSDTAEDTGPTTAEVTVSNVGDVELAGTFYYEDWMIVDGVGLMPGDTTSWTLDAPVSGNLVYVDLNTDQCWGAHLSLAVGDVLQFDVPNPTGELSWEGDLRSCDLPDE